jgi:hypothetical protein
MGEVEESEADVTFINHDDIEVVFVCGFQVAKSSLKTLKTLPRVGDSIHFQRSYRVHDVVYHCELNEDSVAYPTRITVCLKMIKIDEAALEHGEIRFK